MFDHSRGFGFVERADGGKDVYVHKTALAQGTRALEPGDRVEFYVEEGDRGPRASDVKLVE
jgi:CspA family cold shock protein